MLAYVVYYLLGVGAYAMAVANDPASPLGIRDLMSVEAAGIFFSNLTPNGTGGAPAQIFRLTRAGLSMGQAGALQYTRFIIYEAAEGIFAAIMLIFRLDYFTSTYGDVFLVGAILFGCKIASVAGLLLVCLFPRPTMALGNALIGFLERRRWLKRPEHWREVVNTQLLDFSRGFRAAAANVRGMLATLALTLIQLGCLYALPWFVLRAFHIEADSPAARCSSSSPRRSRCRAARAAPRAASRSSSAPCSATRSPRASWFGAWSSTSCPCSPPCPCSAFAPMVATTSTRRASA